MEAAAGLRFDTMDELIFQPMGLGCSYDVGALEGIENLAALYRNQGGCSPPSIQRRESQLA